MLPNLYQAVLYNYGQHAVSARITTGCVWQGSSKTFEGSAVKVAQHTQLPFGTFFVQVVN